MKKPLFVFCLLASGLMLSGQNTLYKNIKQLILQTHPEISTDNRLIAFNIWSMDDQESRETNKGFERAYQVYEFARLKGGSKGMIVIAVNKDNLSPEAVITFSKDGITKMIPVKISDLKGIGEGISNCVFDSNGNQVYSNLSAPLVYSSINHLITR